MKNTFEKILYYIASNLYDLQMDKLKWSVLKKI
jgi:hypothetical protein